MLPAVVGQLRNTRFTPHSLAALANQDSERQTAPQNLQATGGARARARGASTTNTRLPSPPQRRTATWTASGAKTGRAVQAAGAGCCMG